MKGELPMTTVAFLQNMWVRNPERVRDIYAKHIGDMDRRAKLNARFLFRESLTGNRLAKAFGESCRDIVWEEVSKEIGGESSAAFPANTEHMCAVLNHHRPGIVLAFGRIAVEAMRRIDCDGFDRPYRVINGPHPAARHATVVSELAAMAEKARDASR